MTDYWQEIKQCLTSAERVDILSVMPARSIRENTNFLTKGKLDTRLVKWRAAGLTYRSMARKLEDELGISVTEETVRVWCLEIASERKAS